MATRVGIISDTHGMIAPKALKILETCDYILHAGDLDREEVLDKIRYMGKLYAVQGNCDMFLDTRLSVKLCFQIEKVRFVMVHNRKDVGSDLSRGDVIVYGHTHVPDATQMGKHLWLNPGSVSRPRGGNASMAVMEIDGKDYTYRFIDLWKDEKEE